MPDINHFQTIPDNTSLEYAKHRVSNSYHDTECSENSSKTSSLPESNSFTPLKRRPGRPSTKVQTPSVENLGIVNQPKDSNNRLEFAYSDPAIFKVLFTYFKNIKAREIHLRCTPSGLTFFARDHTKASRIIAQISGNLVSWHFCEEELWLGLNRENVEKIFTVVIDKTFYKISIIQHREDPNHLIFVYRDSAVDKACSYKVTLSTHGPDYNLYESENMLISEEFLSSPLSFTLTSRQFKKTISDISNFSDLIAVEKIGNHPLNFTYALSHIKYSEVYLSGAKIDLKSALDTEDSFRCIIKTDNIKALASSMLADKIHVYCREGREILFRSIVGSGALVINTITKLE